MRDLRLVLIFVCLLGGVVMSAAGDEHSFELSWRPSGFNRTIRSMMEREEPFTAEPDIGDRVVCRGILYCDSLNSDGSNMGFLWDKSEGKLYLDLNRDGDLTNDPNGVLTGEGERDGGYIHQVFPEFQLSLSADSSRHRYNISANLISYSGSKWKNADFSVQSGYEGSIELNGEPWSFRIIDALKGRIKPGDLLSVFPEADGGQELSFLPLTENLFLFDRCYAVDFEFKPGDNQTPRLWCRLTEKEVPLASLRLDGQGVGWFVFGNEDTLVLPRLSEDAMTAPVGEYHCKGLFLKPLSNAYPPAHPQNVRKIAVSVAADTDNVLKVGAPLNHSVTIERSGRVLTFNHQLIGGGGETYDFRMLTGYASDNKPAVTIYKGDVQLASGEFEYG